MLKNEVRPSPDSMEMAPQDTLFRPSAKVLPSGAETTTNAEETPCTATSHSAENAALSGVRSCPNEATMSSETSPHRSTMTEAQGVPSSLTLNSKLSDGTHHPAKELSAFEVNPTVRNEGRSSPDNTSPESPDTSESDSVSYPTVEEVVPPGNKGNQTEDVASSVITPIPNRAQDIPSSVNNSSAIASSSIKFRPTEEPTTPNIHSLVRQPVISGQSISLTATVDRLSAEAPPNDNIAKESVPVHKPSEKTLPVDTTPGKMPTADHSSGKASSIDEPSHRRVNSADKPSEKTSPDARLLPVEVALSDVKSYPIQVPSPMETSGPFKVDQSTTASKVEEQERRAAQSNVSSKPDR